MSWLHPLRNLLNRLTNKAKGGLICHRSTIGLELYSRHGHAVPVSRIQFTGTYLFSPLQNTRKIPWWSFGISSVHGQP